MGNKFNENPWILDTAGATSLWDAPVKIDKIVWYQPAAADDDISLTYKNGAEIWTDKALATGVAGTITKEFYGRSYDSFYITTLDSGTVKVYIR